MKLLHQPEDLIAQKYRIVDILGQGGIGITYKAEDLQSGDRVALKTLSLRRMTDWKTIELFEREARILSQLDHPAIPRYLDYFQVDTESDRRFYIAQQLAEGQSLADLIENGWQPDENQVRQLAVQILEILVYLHSLTLPVIHRDIKPQNIIQNSDGQVFLVDFGAVQDTYHNTVTGGSTIVGTYGYMAPEQFRGQAVLSTDLYGLGTTLLFLLTRQSPADLPIRQLKINFRSHISVSKEFADWLEKMLEPVIEDRFNSAKTALAVLRGEQKPLVNTVQKRSRPKNSSITLTRTVEELIVKIPPVWLQIWLRLDRTQEFILICLFGTGILSILFFMILFYDRIFNMTVLFLFLIILFVTISYGFGIIIIIFLLWYGLKLLSAAFSTRIEIDREHFQIQRSLLGYCYQKIHRPTASIIEVKVSPIDGFCVLREKLNRYWFGLFLSLPEQEWLVGEIKAFLEKVRS